MIRAWPHPGDFQVIQIAQYLSSLTTHQEVWAEAGKALVKFLDAQVVAFGQLREDGTVAVGHWAVPDHLGGAPEQEPLEILCRDDASRENLTELILSAVAETLESGFFTARLVCPAQPLSLAFLPITEENRIAAVMIAGYAMDEPFPRELLNVYLAVAGLVGSVAARLSSERELRHHRYRLEELVRERTFKLRRTNELLQQEVERRTRMEKALEQRMIALTRPLDDAKGITFEDLFNRDDIQRLQDDFSEATGVASIIVAPDGTAITRPTNYRRLCAELIRASEAGRASCRTSMAAFGTPFRDRPVIKRCLSSGLWEAGAGIFVGGQHIANWLIGQVRVPGQTEADMRLQAERVGFDADLAAAAFSDVPVMAYEHFERVARALFTLANQLSAIAYQNVQQARFITERRRIEEALAEAKELAEAANKTKSLFLANMSHDIRTPLNSVMGMLQLMQTTCLDQEQQTYVESAYQSSRRLTKLLSDILDLSKVEAGRLEISAEPIDFDDTMQTLVQLFQPAAAEKGLRLRLHLDPAVPPRLRGDATRLRQILNNLVGNAVKFTQSGEIAMEASLLPAPGADRCRVLFSISDTGIGIAAKDLDRLFEPFAQAGDDVSRKSQGFGLGLSICQRLVRLMDGSLCVDSAPGEGSTFLLCLPFALSGAQLPRAAAAGPAASVPLDGCKILLADDTRVSSTVTKRMLEKAGCRVTDVGNGREVLEALRRERFDIVLMDVQMPDMDGLEATRAIREGAAGAAMARVPIIAVTAFAMAGDRERFLACGMDDYVEKPIEMAVLRTVLGRRLGQAGGTG